MKHLRLFYFIFLLPIIAFVACSKEDNDSVDTELILSKTEITIPQTGETAIFYIKSNVDWQLSGATDWCTVSPTSGSAGKTTKVVLTVSDNNSNDERIATLTVQGGGDTETLTVKQALNFLLTQGSYQAKAEGEVIEVKLKSDGTKYEITSAHSWIAHNEAVRSVSDKVEYLTVDGNYTNKKRTGVVTFTVNGKAETIKIEQEAMAIPAATQVGVESDAKVLAAKIKIGWNLGNSLEANGNEVAWGNPKTTQAIIDMVKAAGFNAIRIPCNWHNGYIEDEVSCQIKTEWMERVKEVVDYCVGQHMYAILNIHYDGGWLEVNPTYAKQEEVNRKQQLLWTQIATRFRDYDEHLLFAGTNEVHVEGVYDNNQVSAENHEVQQSFNQTFVDAVRATGGRNANRNLIVQAYNTNVELAVSYMKMPTDLVANRLMMEVHFYDPWDYAGDVKSAYWGEPYKSYGILSYGQEAHVDASFKVLKDKFVDQGVPVVLGEYGANRHSMTNQVMIDSRAYYLEYVTKSAKNNGLIPFYWDNGGMGNGDTQDQFGIFDRKGLKVFDQSAVDGIMKGAEAGVYPF